MVFNFKNYLNINLFKYLYFMADFEKVLIKDDRLVCSDKITYAVIKGAMNNTVVPFNAISGTAVENPASLTWNIQVPSEQIVIDRRVVVETTITMEVDKVATAGAVALAGAEPKFNNSRLVGSALADPTNATNVVYGADCLNYLPFHQLVNTAQITINNTAVSLNVQDVLPALARFNDSRYINEMNGYTPLQVDKVASYGTTTNNIANGVSALGVISSQIVMNDPNSPFSTNTSSLDEAFVPRGSFPVRFVDSLNGSNLATQKIVSEVAVGDKQYVRFTVREPLMVSPFIWACPQENSQGIYGVQNLSIVLNLSNAQRMVRSRASVLATNGVLQTGGCVVSKFMVNSCRLLMNFLTPQPSDLLVPRNVVPYQEFPRYFAQQTVGLEAATYGGVGSPSGIVPATANVSFNSIQLNQIPDKLIIFARNNTTYNTNPLCSDHFCGIEKININFNNQSGLLSTWTVADLYRASRRNGSTQSWYEFSGVAQKDNGVVSAQAPDGTSNAGAPPTTYASTSVNIPTTGAMIVLEFGTDIELPDYYACGSLGNFNLQFDLTCVNYGLKAENMQLMLITMNSGVFVTEKGNSSVYTGLLTKQDVLEASSMSPITSNQFKRMVGGGFWDSIKSIGSKVWRGVKSALPVASQVASAVAPMLGQYGAPIAQGLATANKLVNSGSGMGYGRSKVSNYLQ